MQSPPSSFRAVRTVLPTSPSASRCTRFLRGISRSRRLFHSSREPYAVFTSEAVPLAMLFSSKACISAGSPSARLSSFVLSSQPISSAPAAIPACVRRQMPFACSFGRLTAINSPRFHSACSIVSTSRFLFLYAVIFRTA